MGEIYGMPFRKLLSRKSKEVSYEGLDSNDRGLVDSVVQVLYGTNGRRLVESAENLNGVYGAVFRVEDFRNLVANVLVKSDGARQGITEILSGTGITPSE